MSKFLFVVGGVISGIGKGVSAASIGLLLKQRGQTVQCIKLDPYLNINAGVLAPREHGECYLCEDGTECDLDLGHYYRIAGIEVSHKNICTSGTLHKELLEEQENGMYLGTTVQLIPHVTQKIQQRFIDLSKDSDIVIVEIGGTVGDAESHAFFEAIRQFKQQHRDDVLVCMVAPILWVNTVKEFKTKPLQNAIKALQLHGLHADILLCRVDQPLPEKLLDKVADLTGIYRNCIFDAPDVKSIYQIPIELYNRHVDDLIADKFHFKRNGCRIHKYRELVEKYSDGCDLPEIVVGIVGKYDNCDEAYLSLKEALYHAALANNVRVRIDWIFADAIEQSKDVKGLLKNLDALIVPGGFDSRGVLGKIKAIEFVREKKVPFLGICLGLQCAVIEFARNICGLAGANSTEFDGKTTHPVIHFIPGQENLKKKCGTMRLGAFDCELTKGSISHDLYKKKVISERHRHRFEVNEEYVETLAKKGLKVTGRNPDTNLVEIVELDQSQHPFFLSTQAHPEFKSRLGEPNPLFFGLVAAAINNKKT